MSYKDDLSYKIASYNGQGLVGLIFQAMHENLIEIQNLISEGDFSDELVELMDKTREILSHLMISLLDDQFSRTMKANYLKVNELMTYAYLKKDSHILDPAVKFAKEGEEFWYKEAEKISKEKGDKNPKDYSVGATYSKDGVDIYSDKKGWKG